MTHYSPGALRDYLLELSGPTDAAAAAELETHLAECTECALLARDGYGLYGRAAHWAASYHAQKLRSRTAMGALAAATRGLHGWTLQKIESISATVTQIANFQLDVVMQPLPAMRGAEGVERSLQVLGVEAGPAVSVAENPGGYVVWIDGDRKAQPLVFDATAGTSEGGEQIAPQWDFVRSKWYVARALRDGAETLLILPPRMHE